ncbi:hypothetical protein MUK42_16826 [Musa troglodytarum]|uniref:Uncharacterized protein n=1 Tax=Musa troglodytarum TaxID=320322 RepID=A0A9E7HWI9_9LILI|nr:hypothetical protein MUK42_16826 [Musa troglodytarum]
MGNRKGGVGVEDGKQAASGMPSFVSSPVAQNIVAEGNTMHPSRVSDFGMLEQSVGRNLEAAADFIRNPEVNPKPSVQTSISGPSHFDNFSKPLALSNISTSTTRVGSLTVPLHEGQQPHLVSLASGQFENWGETAMADASPRTDTSTDVDADDKNHKPKRGQLDAIAASDSSDKTKEKTGDQKTLRRLAQNREAARKSRLRKKAYVQQLEGSRLKLTQLEQELQRARQQGIFISSSGDQSHAMSGNEALAFDSEYARWREEHNRQISELRTAVNAHASENDLRAIVDGIMVHYDEMFKLKGTAAKADVFHMLSGMWKTPAERCFLWLGGFRSSELLKLLTSQLEPLTEQQLMGLCNLQQSSQQAEDALSQGMEALQQSLAETLAGSLSASGSSGNVANYMGQMAMAMGKLGTLENFLCQSSASREEARKRTINFFKMACRSLPAVMEIYNLDDIVTVSQLRSTVSAEIRKNAHIANPKVIDLLLFKGTEELSNIVTHSKQRHHLIGQYVVGRGGLVQDMGTKDQGISDFLKQFYRSNYF